MVGDTLNLCERGRTTKFPTSYVRSDKLTNEANTSRFANRDGQFTVTGSGRGAVAL